MVQRALSVHLHAIAHSRSHPDGFDLLARGVRIVASNVVLKNEIVFADLLAKKGLPSLIEFQCPKCSPVVAGEGRGRPAVPATTTTQRDHVDPASSAKDGLVAETGASLSLAVVEPGVDRVVAIAHAHNHSGKALAVGDRNTSVAGIAAKRLLRRAGESFWNFQLQRYECV